MHESYYRNVDMVPRLVGCSYEIGSEAEDLFSGRRFTLDGHIVGSSGEVMAQYPYDLELFAARTERHGAAANDGRLVQIKATQGERVHGRRVGLRNRPDHLIVLLVKPDHSAEEVFNDPGSLAWDNAGEMQNNGECPITLSRLRTLMAQGLIEARLPAVNR
jgi:hypothetical protein